MLMPSARPPSPSRSGASHCARQPSRAAGASGNDFLNFRISLTVSLVTSGSPAAISPSTSSTFSNSSSDGGSDAGSLVHLIGVEQVEDGEVRDAEQVIEALDAQRALSVKKLEMWACLNPVRSASLSPVISPASMRFHSALRRFSCRVRTFINQL